LSEQPESRALAVAEEARALSLTRAKLDLITRTVANGASIDELAIFLYQCRRTGLDPLSRQLYCIMRQGKATLQTGIDGYRLIAQRTKQYAGMDPILYDEGLTEYEMLHEGRQHPTTCTVTVYRLLDGIRFPFSATAAWDEYKPAPGQSGNGDSMWRKMPYTMLSKCSEALALRRGFPQELGGIYTHEEMEQAGPAITVESRDVTGQPPPTQASPGREPAPRTTPRADHIERLNDAADPRWQWFIRLAQVAATLKVPVPKLDLPVTIPQLEAANKGLERGIQDKGGDLPEPIEPPADELQPPDYVEEAEWRETTIDETEQAALV
jgi:phage recombination protein Bet